MKKALLCSFATLLPLVGNAEDIHKDNEFQDPDYETPGYVITPKATTALMQEMQPTMKFGGYIMGKYSVNDRKGQATNGGFDLRFIRLYADGHVYKDFYYKFQLEVNGAPGENKGPRVLDAFIEWQKYDFLRDLGIQLQGDIFPAADNHKLLHYQVGFFNGQGINHADKDHHKDLIGGLWFSPVKNLAIGGFGWNGKYTNEKYNATNPGEQLKSVKRVRWGSGLKYEGKWTLRGEYMSSVGGVTTDAGAPDRSDAWYATLGVPVTEKFKVFGHYDCYRNDKHTWASMNTNYGLTGNYWLGKNLLFQLNYTFTDNRAARGKDSHYNTVDVQVTARF